MYCRGSGLDVAVQSGDRNWRGASHGFTGAYPLLDDDVDDPSDDEPWSVVSKRRCGCGGWLAYRQPLAA